MPINTDPRNDSIAKMFYDSAMQGDPEALYKLGYWYAGKAKTLYENHLADADILMEKAVDYSQRAANRGYAKACYWLGQVYGDARFGVPENLSLSTHYYEQAAELGIAYGAFNAGIAYLKGNGVPKNFDKALTFLDLAKRLAEQEQNPEIKQKIMASTNKSIEYCQRHMQSNTNDNNLNNNINNNVNNNINNNLNNNVNNNVNNTSIRSHHIIPMPSSQQSVSFPLPADFQIKNFEDEEYAGEEIKRATENTLPNDLKFQSGLQKATLIKEQAIASRQQQWWEDTNQLNLDEQDLRSQKILLLQEIQEEETRAKLDAKNQEIQENLKELRVKQAEIEASMCELLEERELLVKKKKRLATQAGEFEMNKKQLEDDLRLSAIEMQKQFSVEQQNLENKQVDLLEERERFEEEKKNIEERNLQVLNELTQNKESIVLERQKLKQEKKSLKQQLRSKMELAQKTIVEQQLQNLSQQFEKLNQKEKALKSQEEEIKHKSNQLKTKEEDLLKREEALEKNLNDIAPQKYFYEQTASAIEERNRLVDAINRKQKQLEAEKLKLEVVTKRAEERIETFDKMCQKGKEPLLINLVKTKQFKKIKQLIEMEQDINVQDEQGRTALHWAFVMQESKIIHLILSNDSQYAANPNLIDTLGMSVLHIAFNQVSVKNSKKSIEYVNLLLDYQRVALNFYLKDKDEKLASDYLPGLEKMNSPSKVGLLKRNLKEKKPKEKKPKKLTPLELLWKRVEKMMALQKPQQDQAVKHWMPPTITPSAALWRGEDTWQLRPNELKSFWVRFAPISEVKEDHPNLKILPELLQAALNKQFDKMEYLKLISEEVIAKASKARWLEYIKVSYHYITYLLRQKNKTCFDNAVELAQTLNAMMMYFSELPHEVKYHLFLMLGDLFYSQGYIENAVMYYASAQGYAALLFKHAPEIAKSYRMNLQQLPLRLASLEAIETYHIFYSALSNNALPSDLKWENNNDELHAFLKFWDSFQVTSNLLEKVGQLGVLKQLFISYEKAIRRLEYLLYLEFRKAIILKKPDCKALYDRFYNFLRHCIFLCPQLIRTRIEDIRKKDSIIDASKYPMFVEYWQQLQNLAGCAYDNPIVKIEALNETYCDSGREAIQQATYALWLGMCNGGLNTIFDVQNQFTKNIIDIFRERIKSLATRLDLLIGPPCDYVLVVVGSGSRQALFPSSDLDCHLLIGDEQYRMHDYFQNLVKLLSLSTNLLGGMQKCAFPTLCLDVGDLYYYKPTLEDLKVTPFIHTPQKMLQACLIELNDANHLSEIILNITVEISSMLHSNILYSKNVTHPDAGNKLYEKYHEIVQTELERAFDDKKKTYACIALSLLKNHNANSIVKIRKLTDKQIKLKEELLTPLSNALIFFAMAYGCRKQDLKSVHTFLKQNALMNEKVLTCFYQALNVLHYLRCALHLKTGWGCDILTRDETSLRSLADGLLLSKSQYDLLLDIETLLLKPIYAYVGQLYKTCIEPEQNSRAPFPKKIACEFDMDKLEDLLESLNNFNYPIDDMIVSEHAWERHLLPTVEAVNANNNVLANLSI